MTGLLPLPGAALLELPEVAAPIARLGCGPPRVPPGSAQLGLVLQPAAYHTQDAGLYDNVLQSATTGWPS